MSLLFGLHIVPLHIQCKLSFIHFFTLDEVKDCAHVRTKVLPLIHFSLSFTLSSKNSFGQTIVYVFLFKNIVLRDPLITMSPLLVPYDLPKALGLGESLFALVTKFSDPHELHTAHFAMSERS